MKLWERIGRPIVLRESKSPWEGLAHISRIVFRAINQRDLISRRNGEKMRTEDSFRGYIPPFPLCSVPTVVPGR